MNTNPQLPDRSDHWSYSEIAAKKARRVQRAKIMLEKLFFVDCPISLAFAASQFSTVKEMLTILQLDGFYKLNDDARRLMGKHGLTAITNALTLQSK